MAFHNPPLDLLQVHLSLILGAAELPDAELQVGSQNRKVEQENYLP